MKNLLITISLSIGLTLQSIAQTPNIQWQKTYGGTLDDVSGSVKQTTDGGYIVAGTSESNDGDVSGNHGNYDMWLVKMNALGTIQWQKSLGGTIYDSGWYIEQTNDGGYVVTGASESNNGDVSGNHGNLDIWVLKLNSGGAIQWQKCLGGGNYDEPNSISLTMDGGFIIGGTSQSNDGDVTFNHGIRDCWVVKLDSVGTIQWQKSYGGTNDDFAYSVKQTTDSGYIMTGWTFSNDGDVSGNHGLADYWVVKLNSSGTIQWKKCLGGSYNEQSTSIQQTSDSGYIVAGASASNNGNVTGNHGGFDQWIVKLDGSGIILWQKCLGGTNNDLAPSIQQTIDGNYIVAGGSLSNDGDVTGNHGGEDFWVSKIDTSGVILWQKSLGGTSNDEANSIQQTMDGDFIVSGWTYSNDGDVTGNHGNRDFWIVKLDCGIITPSITASGSTSFCSGGSVILTSSSPSGNTWSNMAATQSITVGQSGVYSVTVSSTSCSATSSPVTVTVIPSPTIILQPINQSVMIGGNTQFIVSCSDSNATYQWQTDTGSGFQNINNGGQFNGSSNDTLTVSNVVSGNNNQTFRCIISNGSCLDTSNAASLTINTSVWINTLPVDIPISIYPNPANTQINVLSDANFVGTPFIIYDALGKAILHDRINSVNSMIDLRDLSDGIYLLYMDGIARQSFAVIKE